MTCERLGGIKNMGAAREELKSMISNLYTSQDHRWRHCGTHLPANTRKRCASPLTIRYLEWWLFPQLIDCGLIEAPMSTEAWSPTPRDFRS